MTTDPRTTSPAPSVGTPAGRPPASSSDASRRDDVPAGRPGTDRPDDRALWDAAARTLRDEVLPAVRQGPARLAARSLLGMAEYAAARPADRGAERAALLATLLGTEPDAGVATVLARASDVLVRAVADPAGHDPVAERVRDALVAMAGEDADELAPMLEHFGGHGDHGGNGVGVPAAVPAEAAALTAWVAEQAGRPLRTVRARTISGGYSRRMVELVLTGTEPGTAGGGELALVVRIEQGGVFGSDGRREAALLRAVGSTRDPAVPVPHVLWDEPTGVVVGQPFFVMARVDGGDEADPRALDDFVLALHHVHGLPPAVAEPAFGPVPTSAEAGIAAQVDHWEAVYRRSTAMPVPLLDEGFAWLRRNLRPTGDTVLVHGDPGPGNFLWRDGRLRAVLDWELAHYGDAAEDWTYLAHLRGRRARDPQAWRDHLRATCGVSYGERDWHAWRVFNACKGAAANLTARRVFLDGVAPRPDLLAVGTAVHLRFVRELAALVAEDPGGGLLARVGTGGGPGAARATAAGGPARPSASTPGRGPAS